MKEPEDADLWLDCVAMKRRIQAEIHERTKHLSMAELVEYLNSRKYEGTLGEFWKSIQKEGRPNDAPEPPDRHE